MNRAASETWSITRSLAFLAATFAIVLGTLMPFAAMAASVPGQPIVLCSVEGPRTIQSGGPTEQHPDEGLSGAKCAACVMPLLGTLPPPPAPEPAVVIRIVQAIVHAPVSTGAPPPARAPPRPYSTAPPQA